MSKTILGRRKVILPSEKASVLGLDVVDDRVGVLEETVPIIRQDVDNNEAKSIELEQGVQSSSEKVDALDVTLGMVQEDLPTDRENIATLQGNVTTLQGNVTTLQSLEDYAGICTEDYGTNFVVMTDNTETKVDTVWDSEAPDKISESDKTNSRCVFGADGYYFISLSITFTLDTGGVWFHFIPKVSGNPVKGIQCQEYVEYGGVAEHVSVSGIAHVTQGDVLELFGFHNTGADVKLFCLYATLSLIKIGN